MRERLWGMGLKEVREFYARLMGEADVQTLRWMCQHDRFFLLTCVLGFTYLNNEWGYVRCREVEAEPDGYLDLWSRGHFKSTLITLGGTVQDVLRDPECTNLILSYNNKTAGKFVGQIKEAFQHRTLVGLFPDVLWDKEPKTNWSVQNGLWVRRRSLAKEPTVMGSGLVDGMPTGMHFGTLIYDDVVTPQSVTNTDQIQRTNEAVEISAALGMGEGTRVRYIGTRYHPMDTYSMLIKRRIAPVRVRLCEDGDGNPTLLTRKGLAKMRQEMGPRTYAAQMMQNPVGEGVAYFSREWCEFYDTIDAPERRRLNVVMLIDSAHGKRKNNDYTMMWVVGLGGDRNYYVLDLVRDRMDLRERTEKLFEQHRQWRPERVWWEQVGAMSDVEHVREIMRRDGYRFEITPLKQRVAKQDRIGWLVPVFESRRIILPRRRVYHTVGGDTRDLIQDFLNEEYEAYPVVSHDDMLDALANLEHPDVKHELRWPEYVSREEAQREAARARGAWGVRR